MLMRLKNQQNITSRVHKVQFNEIGNQTDNEDDLQERENLMGKIWFLSWVGAGNCIKDKVTSTYAIQMMGIDAMETKSSQPL